MKYRFRDEFPDRWVRFHALPDSKRYPDDEGEYAEILGRHNRILDMLVGPEERVILLATGYSESPDPASAPPEVRGDGPPLVPWRSIPMHVLEGESFPRYWHVYAAERQWRPGAFDAILRRIADEEVDNVMIVDPDCRWIHLPYDGGMDVILESTAARDRLRSMHPDWLSPRPDGL